MEKAPYRTSLSFKILRWPMKTFSKAQRSSYSNPISGAQWNPSSKRALRYRYKSPERRRDAQSCIRQSSSIFRSGIQRKIISQQLTLKFKYLSYKACQEQFLGNRCGPEGFDAGPHTSRKCSRGCLCRTYTSGHTGNSVGDGQSASKHS